MADAPFSAQIEERGASPTIGVQITTSKDKLAEVFATYPAKVFHRLMELGAPPIGALYARYPTFSDEAVDVEIGVPVAAPVAGLEPVSSVSAGEVGASELPAGRVAVTIHVGPYDGLPATYDRLHGWIHSMGESAGAGPWESYLDDPGDMSDMSGVRTEVVWPLA